jgi:hypothetical protein
MIHLHLFSQMVIVPRQQKRPWPICLEESKVTIPGLRINRDLRATATNTVNKINKLVMVFAEPHLDCLPEN